MTKKKTSGGEHVATRWDEMDREEAEDYYRRQTKVLKESMKIDGETREGEQTWVEEFQWNEKKLQDEWVPIYWGHEEGEMV